MPETGPYRSSENRTAISNSIHILNPQQAREYDKTGLLNCEDHAHCRREVATTMVDKRIAEHVTPRIICLRPQALAAKSDNRPWQAAGGWKVINRWTFPQTQLITDRNYRLT